MACRRKTKEKLTIKVNEMDIKNLKNILKESIETELELYDFCIECIQKLYPDESSFAVSIFKEGYDYRDYNGGIQTFSCIASHVINNRHFKEKASTFKEENNVE